MTPQTGTAGTPIQGVTLYSFTRLFHGRELSFADIVRKVAAEGLGPGLEIVGFQSIRNFPKIEPSFVHEFRELMDETGLVPTALGANADAGLRSGRLLNSDEMVEYMAAQLKAASTLGFPIVRVQFSVTPDDMERLLPLAESYGITLGMEIHAHHSVRHPVMDALLNRFEKLDSPHLGFIPDWGASMMQMPRTLLQRELDKGISPELVRKIDAFWNEQHRHGAPLDDSLLEAQFHEVLQLAADHGHEEAGLMLAVNATSLFGHAKPEEWRDILPWAVHTHGKFYEIDETGKDPSVPIAEIIDLYVDNGYSKTISTEWEGFHWNATDNPFELIQAQQRLIRDTAANKGSRIVTDPAEARRLMASKVQR